MESSTALPIHHGLAADRRRGCVIKLPSEARSVPPASPRICAWPPTPARAARRDGPAPALTLRKTGA
jgi:hypothetical protein